MHGIVNRFTAHPGQRDALVAAMTSDGAASLEGCRSFVVAHDADPDVVWVTEVWESREAWRASLERPAVKASIEVAVPLVKDWGTPVETVVVAVLRG